MTGVHLVRARVLNLEGEIKLRLTITQVQALIMKLIPLTDSEAAISLTDLVGLEELT